MKILLISRGIPTRDNPQWGCFEKDQAEALSSHGHEVIVVSVDGRFNIKKRKVGYTEVRINGVDYVDLYIFPYALFKVLGEKLSTHLILKFCKIAFNRIFKRIYKKYGKPDIIYSHFYFNTAYVIGLKSKYGVPVIGIEHAGMYNNDKLPYKYSYFGKIAYKSADAIISVSETLKDRIWYHFKRDSYVVHNAIGSEFKFKNSKPDKFTFITVASLLHLKGLDLLVPAFKLAGIPFDKWKMYIIGDGPEYGNLSKQIHESGFQDNIFLLGKKNKVEIAELLNNSNVFILPSRMENFSVAILEALACGLPVIASLCGGVRECISDNNGILFPVDNVNALSNAIKNIYSKYDSYDRLKIAEDCNNQFSSEVIAQKLTDIFYSVLKNN